MISEFKDLYEDKESCLNEISNKHSFIFEDENQKKGIFVTDKDNYHVHVENQKKTLVHFIQNDNCVMINQKGGQCDYLFFNNEEIHFVEVKATNQNLKNHKAKLYKQLESSFNFYADFLKHFKSKNALVCFESINKRGYTKRKVPTASKSEKKLYFKIKYDIDLTEGNYINFE